LTVCDIAIFIQENFDILELAQSLKDVET